MKLKTRTNQPVEGNELDGDLNVAGKLTGNEIIENMSGYSYVAGSQTGLSQNTIYAGVCKNGNKLTFVLFKSLTRTDTIDGGFAWFGDFYIPDDINAKLYPYTIAGLDNILDYRIYNVFPTAGGDAKSIGMYCSKSTGRIGFTGINMNELTLNTQYVLRIEMTFLLSDNLAD